MALRIVTSYFIFGYHPHTYNQYIYIYDESDTCLQTDVLTWWSLCNSDVVTKRSWRKGPVLARLVVTRVSTVALIVLRHVTMEIANRTVPSPCYSHANLCVVSTPGVTLKCGGGWYSSDIHLHPSRFSMGATRFQHRNSTLAPKFILVEFHAFSGVVIYLFMAAIYIILFRAGCWLYR
jgi:hypothetical protein